MTRHDLIRLLLPVLQGNEFVLSASLFGSFARGEATDASDVDLLIDFKRGMTFFKLSTLERDLEAAARRKVDVVTPRSLNPFMRDAILADSVKFYERA